MNLVIQLEGRTSDTRKRFWYTSGNSEDKFQTSIERKGSYQSRLMDVRQSSEANIVHGSIFGGEGKFNRNCQGEADL